MQHGKEKIHGRKLFLAVNSQGFGSVYALIILQVVLVFSLTLLTMAQHQAKLLQVDKQLQETELFAIYYVKNALHRDLLAKEDVIDENQEAIEPEAMIQHIAYEQQEITITFEDTMALVEMDAYALQIFYDKTNKCILDLVYL